MTCFRFFPAFLAVASLHVSAQEISSDGTPRTFDLPGGNAVPTAFVEVPEGSQQLRIQLEGETGADAGLMVRFGSPFDLVDFDGEQIDFMSVGPDHFEHLTITRASNPPLRAGRWYVMPINWDDETVALTVTISLSDDPELDPLEIQVVYDSQEEDDETGFFDPAPFSSPHNPAETLGEARRRAFEKAVEIVAGNLTDSGVTSPVPVVVAARFEDLSDEDDEDEDDDDLITLAFARPFTLFRDFFGALETETWYATPLAAKQAGTDICRINRFHAPPDGDDGSFEPPLDCNTPDVLATFNTLESVDNLDWSYALDDPPSHPADFISTAMHEVTHGLGFLSVFSLEDDEDGEFEAGEMEGGFPDIYTRNLIFIDNGSETPLYDLENAGRIEAATSVDGLRWGGQAVAGSPGNPFADLGQLFAMYAPAEVQPGSSVSHVDNRQPVPASELMRPQSTGFSPRNIGNTAAFMLDMGWGGRVFGSAGQGHPIHFGMNGLWYNPETSGQGVLLDIAATQDPPQATAFWFTFADQAGGPEGQRWYTAQGDYSEGDSGVEMTVFMTTGGEFDRRPPTPETTPVGEMTLVFQSCTGAMLSYDFNLDGDATKRVQGVVPLNRLSPDVYCAAGVDPENVPIIDPRPPAVIDPVLNGVWYEPATSGQGVLFDVVEGQNPPQVTMLWFTFAESAGGSQAQRWFIAQGDYTPGAREVKLDVRMSLGGEFDRRPPAPSLVTVGTAELEFESCTEAGLEYDLDLDDAPGEGTQGRIALRRLTPDILCHRSFR